LGLAAGCRLAEPFGSRPQQPVEPGPRCRERIAVQPHTGARHEPDLDRAGAPPFADDEIAQRSLAGAAVIRRQRLLATPGDDLLARLVPAFGGEQAVGERDDLIPPPGRVKAADELAGVVGAERIFELVAVAPLLDRGHDRLQRESIELSDPPQRLVDLRLLELELALVWKHLPRRSGMVGEGRDPVRARHQHLDGARLGVGALALADHRADAIARDRALDEHDIAVQACDAGAAVRERVDPQLELVAALRAGLFGFGRLHRLPAWQPPPTGRLAGAGCGCLGADLGGGSARAFRRRLGSRRGLLRA